MFMIIVQKSYAQGAYSIQLGAYTNQKNYEQYQKKLDQAGVAYWVREGRYKFIYHGQFSSRAEAEKALKALQTKKISGYIRYLEKAPSKENIETKIQESLPQIEPEKVQVESTLTETGLKGQVASVTAETKASVKNILFQQDLVFQGVFGNHSLFFTVNPHWEIQDTSHLYLQFNYSQPMANYGSSLTVYINGVPIHSEALIQAGIEKQVLKIPLATHLLKEGVNELKIKTYHRISDQACLDENNPQSWVVILKNSYLNLQYTEKNQPTSLRDYPYPYFKIGSDQLVDSKILIPENYGLKDLKGALMICSDLGRRLPFENIEPQIESYKPEGTYTGTHLIWLGDYKSLPQRIKDQLEAPISQGEWILEIENPWDKAYKMMLILGEEEALVKGVKALASPEIGQQWQQAPVSLGASMVLTEKDSSKADYHTFNQMGYGDVLLQGERYNSQEYELTLPKNWRLNEEAQLFLKLKYSDVIEYNRSSVSIFLNDVPIFSKKLVPEGATGDSVFIPIPKAFRDQAYLKLRVSFSLEVPRDCQSAGFDKNIWAFVDGNSYLYLAHEEREQFNLSYYPSPFVKSKGLADTSILVQPGTDLSLLGHILSYWGHSLEKIEDFKLVWDDAEKALEGNVLFIGNLADSPNGQAINKRLKVPYAADLKTYAPEVQDLIAVDTKQVAVLQGVLDDKGYLLALTALDHKLLKDSGRYLWDFEFVNKLQGEAVALYANGQSMVLIQPQTGSVDTPIELKKAVNTEALERVSGEELRQYLLYLLALGFVGVIIIILKKK